MKDVQVKLNENSNSLKFSRIYLDKLKNPTTLRSIILFVLFFYTIFVTNWLMGIAVLMFIGYFLNNVFKQNKTLFSY